MTILVLDGDPIVLKNCRINPSFEIKEEDMSGQGSSTSSSEQGDKGQELNVLGTLPFKDIEQLGKLYQLARAKSDDGQRKIYVIGSEVSRALKIRQVRFAGRVQATEQQGLLAWNISFRLREHLSVSEQEEKRSYSQATPSLSLSAEDTNKSQTDILNKQIEAQLNDEGAA